MESAKADSLANTQTEVDLSVFSSWVDAVGTQGDRAGRVLREALPSRVQAGGRRRGWRRSRSRTRTRRCRPSGCRSTSCAAPGAGRPARGGGRGTGREGPRERPAGDELRARGRAVRLGTVLRRHLDQARDRRGFAGRCSRSASSSFSPPSPGSRPSRSASRSEPAQAGIAFTRVNGAWCPNSRAPAA